jgi:hypothetical protein
MTWIIPSDREGHWNPAGLSLKSPRFLSNRWGPPQWVAHRVAHRDAMAVTALGSPVR